MLTIKPRIIKTDFASLIGIGVGFHHTFLQNVYLPLFPIHSLLILVYFLFYFVGLLRIWCELRISENTRLVFVVYEGNKHIVVGDAYLWFATFDNNPFGFNRVDEYFSCELFVFVPHLRTKAKTASIVIGLAGDHLDTEIVDVSISLSLFMSLSLSLSLIY